MNKFILSPGPTQCRPELLEELSKPVTYHRSEAFHAMYKNIRNKLKQMMALNDGEVIVLTSSGTGSMEASVSNFFSRHDDVLVISVGHFGQRFYDICQTYELNTHLLSYPIGQTYDYEEVKSYISNHPELKGVFITHHETSSGVVNDLKAVGDLVKDLPDCVYIVDSISGFLAHPMYMSDWHIDCLLSCSQKGFLIPPGLAIAALSNKALSHLNRGKLPRFYFDFRKYLNMIEINETPTTPNVSLMCALEKACDYIMDYGLDAYYDYYHDLRVYLEAKLAALGMDTSVVKEEHKGNVLVLVRVKDDWNAKVIHDVLDERGYIVATGFNENKTKMLRVGVIGEVKKEDIDAFIVVLKDVLHELYGF